jgi:DNA-binding transcriptional LysR family regulator
VVNRDRLLDRLGRNQDDLYVMGVPPEHLDTESESFMDNPLVVLAPATHRMVGRKRIPFGELARESFLVRERGSGTRMTMEQVFQERGTPLKIRMELGSNEAIKQAVAGGLGLAMLSRSTLILGPGEKPAGSRRSPEGREDGRRGVPGDLHYLARRFAGGV